ncbi:MAG TPA: ATP-dependent DNA helicase RecG [Candidatus Paceibacterota bacterium]|nr:ATP-dependent DNA helicase RecG [Candidatus Paceibacterota bacterium]
MTLNSKISELSRISTEQSDGLKRLDIETIEDLLYHFPVRYGDTAEFVNIENLAKGASAVVFGKISGLKASKGFRTKITMAEAWVEDESGKIKIVWFNQPYIAKMIHNDALVRVEGKISQKKSLSADRTGELYFSNPKIEQLTKIPVGVGESLFGGDSETHTLYPVYPESAGVTSNWIYHSIQKIFKSGILEEIIDPIPEPILKKYNLPSWRTAIVWIHAPQTQNDALSARKRFAFEEIFFIQLAKQKERANLAHSKAFVIEKSRADLARFMEKFSFVPTNAQNRAIDAILADFKHSHPMTRLLEGDVGSGKTAVAAATAYAVATTCPKNQTSGTLQVAYMVPTEVLAKQHFESFISYFRHFPIPIALITGSGCRKFPSKVNPLGWTNISRSQLLKWVKNGEIPILIGTHALIQKSVAFKHLAYVIIDEQHRFGTAQRQKLTQKNDIMPHLLSMTATPIPRTLALTVYGDLDLTILDEMPAGRKPITTEIVLSNERKEMYEEIRMQLAQGRQAFIICPRINEPNPNKAMAVIARSVTAEAKRLKKDVFQEYEIGILHSKMNDREKEKVMNDFKAGIIHILCATSVVEVGVNVPNATVILIEGAERFGLAQLHQLRGRVIRSNHQAYCFLCAESGGEKTKNRLNALKTAKNGFELAELDLKFRGSGDLYGKKQWGITDVGMEALQNLKMVEAARTEVKEMISKDETLSQFPTVADELLRRESQKVHFE